jgi:anti-sigma B factor antagonist
MKEDRRRFGVAVRRDGEALRAVIEGELDLTTEAELVDCVTSAVEASDATSIVLDVHRVDFIDSSGLRSLLRCRDHAERHGRSTRLAVSEGPVTRLLRAAGVTDWFDYV